MSFATAIISAVDESSYLMISLEEICQGSREQFAVTLAEAEAVQKLVQYFDLQGIGTRSPMECLLLQLEAIPDSTSCLTEVNHLVEYHLKLLANRDFSAPMWQLEVSREELQGIIALVQFLDPRPGAQLSRTARQYAVPNVLVCRQRDACRVKLNPDGTPKIRINDCYAALVRRAGQDNGDRTTSRIICRKRAGS
jgi:RNA polymerase sigma-54 factor